MKIVSVPRTVTRQRLASTSPVSPRTKRSPRQRPHRLERRNVKHGKK